MKRSAEDTIKEVLLHGIYARIADRACYRWCTLRGWSIMCSSRNFAITNAMRTLIANAD